MDRRLNGEFCRAAHRDDVVNGFSTGTTTPFLTAADNKWRQFRAVSNVKRADAFGSMKLVTGNRKEIDRHLFQVYRQLRNRLHAVDVKYGVRMFVNDLSDLFGGKQHARFVI